MNENFEIFLWTIKKIRGEGRKCIFFPELIHITGDMMWFNLNGHRAKSQNQESEVSNERETKETAFYI